MAHVLARFGPAYLARYGTSMPRAHRDAMARMLSCRTAARGGHLLECGRCGAKDFAFHSCGHRGCPKCSTAQGQAWLDERREELLPVPYFHVVFTVPEKLRWIIRTHQRELYPVLLKAVGKTLLQVGRKHVGGMIGAMMVLHTWTRALEYHPHVHCLIPAGHLDAQGQWHAVTRPWFAPRKELALVFRAKLKALMLAAVKGLRLPGSIFRTPWVVHVEQPYHGVDTVLRYLARYIHRGPLSERRILEVSSTHVTFQYRDRERKSWLTMRLKGFEFLRRFLQHVLPKHLHKVRYIGFWRESNRPQLRELRRTLLGQAGLPTVAPTVEPADGEAVVPAWLRCPHCDHGPREIIGHFSAQQIQEYLARQAVNTPTPCTRAPP
ncbi:MAG: transposase [Reyranella sp.]|nr:transposase [Reyranella sp.]